MSVEEPPDSPTRTHAGAASTAPPASSRHEQGQRFLAGTVLAGRYRIVSSLGRGGMGEVYKADDLRLGQPVALKFLPPALEQDATRLERLAAEVRTARQVSHRNVCRVYDLGEADGQHFLSMEYVDGEDLASLLRRIGRLPPDKAIQLARQVCAGLTAAHEAGFLHRDLKPANVMIDGQGRARLTDFGLAVLAGEHRAGEVAGTPAYMAPEQLAGRALSVRTDIYSLGLVLYEMFTGRPAFPAAPLADLHRQRSESQPSRPSLHIADLDPRVERVILRCLEADPAARPPSALAVSAALPGGDPLAEALAAGETPSPAMVAAAGEQGTLSPLAALACLGATLALAGIAYTLWPAQVAALRVRLKPREFLSERAREILRSSAHVVPEADSASGFVYDEEYLAYLERHDGSPGRWDGLATGRPAAVRFWYRQSAEPLASGHPLGRISLADPPSTRPGMASVVLDTQGRLLELLVVPPATVGDAGVPATAFSALMAAAHLDPATLRPATASFTPPVFADERAAWLVFEGGATHALRVEAAALAGQPVFFRVVGPWQEGAGGARSSRAAFRSRYRALSFLMLGAGVVLAWRNLRLGRGDRTGARRLAMAGFSTLLVAWLLSARHNRDLAREWTLFTGGLSEALLGAGLLGLLYLAIEPAIRRRWPGSLTSWTRLLSGRFRDPLVGRDILVGSLAVWALAVVGLCWRGLAGTLTGVPPRLYTQSLDGLLGTHLILANFLTELVNAVHRAMLYLGLFLLLRLLLRNTWVALLAVALILGAALGTGMAGLTGVPVVDVAIFATTLGIVALVLVRFGLLALLVLVLFVRLSFHILPTWNLAAWYATSSRLGLAVTLLLAGYGFVTALAGRPLFKTALLDD